MASLFYILTAIFHRFTAISKKTQPVVIESTMEQVSTVIPSWIGENQVIAAECINLAN